MNRIIITPTFRPHFPFNREFLRSYADHAEDARDVPVHFIVTRDDLADIQALLTEFPALSVHAHALEDLLEASGHREEPLALLREVGKFTYQSLKKLYALKVLPFDQALILDSEALVLKPVRMADVFDAYYADPFVLYSDFSNRGEAWFGGLSNAVVRNAARLLRIPYPKTYFLEYYGWFYDKALIRDLFASFPEDLLPAIRARLGDDTRLFENQLIYTFIATHPERYRYRLVSVNEMLREYLGEELYAEYIDHFQGGAESVGVFEMASLAISEANLPALSRLFTDHRFLFYRFELVNLNEDLQRELIANTPITFLVSSEGYRRKRERVAVCLSGVPRNARQNLRFLRAFLADSDADIFVHCWSTPEASNIVRTLEPEAHVFERSDAAPAPPEFGRMEKAVQPTRAANSTAMFYSMKRANDLKRAHEEEHGFRYDIVVRLRLDFFSTRPLDEIIEQIRFAQKGWDRVVYVPDMAHSVGVNDQIALADSETMDVYAGTYDTLAYVAEHDYFNPEYVLLRHLQRHGLRIRTFGFEYVLLRTESASTFDLERLIQNTRLTWWSAQLPDIRPSSLDAYFAAKAASVPLIDELNLETPKVFRLRAGPARYVHYDSARRTLQLTPDAADASLFYVIIPADGDRTAVNIRPRELVFAAENASRAGAHSYNFYPDAEGVIRPDGPSDEDSAFFVRRHDDGLAFEWRPGFWKSPADPRGPVERQRGGWWRPHAEEMKSDNRLVLQPDRRGLALVPLSDDTEPFHLEYVSDAAAERVEMGLDLTPIQRLGSSADPFPVRMLYLSYLLARTVGEKGVGAVRLAAADYLRRQAHIAERTNAPGFRNAIKRQIGKRL